jgi:hypothetical protein
MSKKRAFVRYTKSGEIVPGSLIITTNGGYPDKSSLWQEVTVDQCCDDTTSCNKKTILLNIDLEELASIPTPYISTEIWIGCRTPESRNTFSLGQGDWNSFEELVTSLNNFFSNSIDIKIISETQISFTYCESNVPCSAECGYEASFSIYDGVSSMITIAEGTTNC